MKVLLSVDLSRNDAPPTTTHENMVTMKLDSTPPVDSFKIRCPRLGQQISFSYCRRENVGLPCVKTLDCWYIYFHVVEHLQQELSDAEWQESLAKPPIPKLLSLAELIDKAQNQAKGKK